jgi:hypothetical protein
MATLNERNELIANADRRAERLISLGADRGVAREIAAIECGLIAGDRVELEYREGRRGDLPFLTSDESGSGYWNSFGRPIPSDIAEIPNILTATPPDPKQTPTGHGKGSHASRL